MPNTVIELLEKAGGDAEEAVTAAKKRWNQQIREILRDLTRLKFQSRQSNDQLENQIVPVTIKNGLPDPLRKWQDTPMETDDRKAYELISLWQADLQRLLDVGRKLDKDLDLLADIPTWHEKALRYSSSLGEGLK